MSSCPECAGELYASGDSCKECHWRAPYEITGLRCTPWEITLVSHVGYRTSPGNPHESITWPGVVAQGREAMDGYGDLHNWNISDAQFEAMSQLAAALVRVQANVKAARVVLSE